MARGVTYTLEEKARTRVSTEMPKQLSRTIESLSREGMTDPCFSYSVLCLG